MSTITCTPSDTRLVTATGPGLVGGNRLAMSDTRLGAETAGHLRLGGRGANETIAVRLVPVRGLPPGVVVAPSPLVEEHRLADDDGWVLWSAAAARVASLELELPADLTLDRAASFVQGSPLLNGHVFSMEQGGVQDTWIDLDGPLFRVRRAVDHAGQVMHGLLSVSADTHVTLFAPGVRSGVDIVVLADCSGSMSIDDIPSTRESVGWGLLGERTTFMTRMDALKSALNSMINARERATGVGTRFALLGFDHDTYPYFPVREGMAEVAAEPNNSSLEQLRGAVALLRYDQRSTDIGQALHKAGELLHRHGVPGNERLIVLVSDGANWSPISDEKSGESVTGIADPVALMEDLHDGLRIRLHVVGISDQDLFGKWWNNYLKKSRQARQQPPDFMVPNHELLGQLVDVAGGDRQSIGGVDELSRYFAELGSGVVRSVGSPGPGTLPKLQISPESIESEARRPLVAPEQQRRWKEEVEQLMVTYSETCEASQTRLGYQIYKPAPWADLKRLHERASNRQEFIAWLSVAYQVFHERLHPPLRHPRKNTSHLDLPELAGPLWRGPLGDIWGLRNYYHHTRDDEEHSKLKAAAGELVQQRNKQHADGQQDPSGKAGAQQDLPRGVKNAFDQTEKAWKDSEKQVKLNAEVGKVIHRHTGQYLVGEQDADGWARLQAGLLRELQGVLVDVREILVSAPRLPDSDGEPADGVPRIVSQGFG
ncbi:MULTISPECIES: VWA domain-containing protein [unclassified Nocardiopsis]|uniref:vWA domain-containing protein n=1 Tax=unclassified Nocardiopsis TaxID=2649073 RepID=UPI00135CB0EE|nr:MULTISPECIES: vWA domain-containing protein [unclassified Nocardiopsis]